MTKTRKNAPQRCPKLIIASDIDGTLVPEGDKSIDPRVYEVIEDLTAKNVRFVPASGRTISSVREVFGPVAHLCDFLSDNGTAVWQGETVIATTPMKRETGLEIASDFLKEPTCSLYLSGLEDIYIISDDQEVLEHNAHFYGDKRHIIQSLDDMTETLLKVTGCFPDGAEAYFKKYLDRYGKDVHVALAGREFLDTCSGSKGHGLAQLADYYDLSMRDTIAFGDNYNDVPMLKAAGTSYIMRTEDENLIKSATHMTDSTLETLRDIYLSL